MTPSFMPLVTDLMYNCVASTVGGAASLCWNNPLTSLAVGLIGTPVALIGASQAPVRRNLACCTRRVCGRERGEALNETLSKVEGVVQAPFSLCNRKSYSPKSEIFTSLQSKLRNLKTALQIGNQSGYISARNELLEVFRSIEGKEDDKAFCEKEFEQVPETCKPLFRAFLEIKGILEASPMLPKGTELIDTVDAINGSTKTIQAFIRDYVSGGAFIYHAEPLASMFDGITHFFTYSMEHYGPTCLKSISGMIENALEKQLVPYLTKHTEIPDKQRNEMIAHAQSAIAALRSATNDDNVDKYKEVLFSVAQTLNSSQYLFNGAALMPSFGSRSETKARRRRVDELVKELKEKSVVQTETAEVPPHIALNRQAEKLVSTVTMMVTGAILQSFLPSDAAEKRIIADIHASIEEDSAFVARNPKGSPTYNQRFEDLYAEQIATIEEESQRDPLQRVWDRVRIAVEDAERNHAQEVILARQEGREDPDPLNTQPIAFAAFSEEISRFIDDSDIAGITKAFLINIMVPLCMSIIPSFLSESVTKTLRDFRKGLHSATKRSEGAKVHVVPTNVIHEITGFIDKTRTSILDWATNDLQAREPAIRQLAKLEEYNEGYTPNEIYTKSGSIAVDATHADSSWEWLKEALASIMTVGPIVGELDWNSPTGAAFNVIRRVANVVVMFPMYSFLLLPYAGIAGISFVGNKAKKLFLKQFVLNPSVISSVVTSGKKALFDGPYMTTINKLLLTQLAEGLNVIKESEKDSEAEIALDSIPHWIESETKPRKEILTQLEETWSHLSTKIDEDDPRQTEMHILLQGTREEIEDNNILQANTYLRQAQKIARRVFTEAKPEDLSQFHPDETKKALADTLKSFLPLLDESGLSREEIANGSIMRSLKQMVNGVVMDQGSDAISATILSALEPMLHKEFIEKQLANILRVSNDALLKKETEPDDLSPEEVQEDVKEAIEHLLKAGIYSNIDKAISSMKHSKYRAAATYVKKMKNEFSTTSDPSKRTNVAAKAKRLIEEYRAERSHESIRGLCAVIAEGIDVNLKKKRKELEDSSEFGAQVKDSLTELTYDIENRYTDIARLLIPLTEHAQADEEMTTQRETLEQAQNVMRESTESLRRLRLSRPFTEEGRLKAHTVLLRAKAKELMSPTTRFTPLSSLFERIADQIDSTLEPLKQVKTTYDIIDRIEARITRIAEAKQEATETLENAQTAGARVTVASSGAAARAIDEERALAEDFAELLQASPSDHNIIKRRVDTLLASWSNEQYVEVQETVHARKTSLELQSTTYTEELQHAFRGGISAIQSLTASGGARREEAIATLVDEIEYQLEQACEKIETFEIPVPVNIDVLDLSSGSTAVEWFKSFIYNIAKERTDKVRELLLTESMYESAVHHALGAVVRASESEEDLLEHKRSVRGRIPTPINLRD